MPRINLPIVRGHHAPALAIGHRVAAIRVFAEISVATPTGWSLFEPAVVDIGAPISVLPPSIWKQSHHTALGRVTIGGIARREECQIPAILAEINCMLSDGQQTLGPLRMHAYLAEVVNAPTLIGILGFLERGVLCVDFPKNRGFLQMT